MCGANSQKLDTVIVEGTILNACEKCKGYGNSVEVKKSTLQEDVFRQKVPRKIYVEDKVRFVIEGAGRIIKSARDEGELTQKQFAKMVGIKESMVHKIETSMMKPEISVANKIEKILDVKIVEDYEDSEKSIPFNLEDGNLTVGDLVKFKKR
tara:strand:+ start:4187 stop:4642 length:456 start_codon:yes stop_codon:yes gene_type:complete